MQFFDKDQIDVLAVRAGNVFSRQIAQFFDDKNLTFPTVNTDPLTFSLKLSVPSFLEFFENNGLKYSQELLWECVDQAILNSFSASEVRGTVLGNLLSLRETQFYQKARMMAWDDYDPSHYKEIEISDEHRRDFVVDRLKKSLQFSLLNIQGISKMTDDIVLVDESSPSLERADPRIDHEGDILDPVTNQRVLEKLRKNREAVDESQNKKERPDNPSILFE